MFQQFASRKAVVRGAFFFLYGGLFHLFLVTRVARWGYAPGSDTRFIDHPLTKLGVVILGGAAVTWFMLRLLESVLGQKNPRSLRISLTGGLYGMLATTLALAVFFILASAFLSFRASLGMGEGLLQFLFYSLGLGTYGMGFIIRSAPFAFASGTIAGVYISLVRRHEGAHTETGGESKGLAKQAAISGIGGVVFIFIPPLGMVLGAIALIWGLRAMRLIRKGFPERKDFAIAGIVLGAICLLFWLFSAVVYALAWLGWIGGRTGQ